MKKTIRLFDENSHLMTFDATVLSCTPGKVAGQFDIILDKTAFFPEGGGQAADPGVLGGFPVLDVQEDKAGIIIHTVAGAPDVGAVIRGSIDRETRLRRMQCHSAEHILSGLIHARYGFDNVGFHLGDDDVTLDFNGVLSRAQLDEIETEANRVVRDCLPITAVYPAPEVLTTLTYRSKLALTEGVRIVTVGAGGDIIDRCACCAPHVVNTGEIGVIKMLDFSHYKGGIRIHMLAGLTALEDYRARYTAVAAIAADMSVKQGEVMVGYGRLKEQIEEQRVQLTALRRELQDLKISALPMTEGSLCLFDKGLDALDMRQLLNRAVEKCGQLCGVFSGDDQTGYAYVIGRGDEGLDLKKYAPLLKDALSARGGGSSEMLQGRSSATRETIQAFFDSFTPDIQETETQASLHKKG